MGKKVTKNQLKTKKKVMKKTTASSKAGKKKVNSTFIPRNDKINTLFAHTFKSTGDCITITDINNNILSVNNAFLKTYGYKEDEIVGKNISILISDNTLKSIPDDVQNVTIQNEWLGELTNKKKDGTEFPICLRISAVRDDDGIPYALVGIARDITEQKKSEQLLKEKEERFRNFYENSPLGIYRSTPEGKVSMVNSTLLKMMGCSSLEEFQQLGLDPLIYSDLINKIEQDGKVSGFEFAWSRKNKPTVYLRINANAIKDHNGKILYFEGTVEDITEKKIVEEELYRTYELFTSGPVTVFKWGKSLEKEIKYISPNVIETLGYTADEFHKAKITIKDLMHPHDYQRVDDEIKININANRSNFDLQFRMRKKNGEYRCFLTFLRIIKNDIGEATYYHGYIFDNTAHNEIEIALKKSEQKHKELNLAKDKFFSVIAHDLRSPFQGLLGMASILAEDEELSSEEKNVFIQKLNEGLKKLFNFVEELLIWSRVQRGVIEFNPSNNNLSEIIRESVDFLKNNIEKKNLKLYNDITDDMTASFDKYMIATVIRNFLSNAIKFTKNNGEIFINTINEPNSVLVTIKDTGIGISEINLQRLFKIDAHFSTKGTDGEGGTGLGLIICKDFIDKHNGRIMVESLLGKGSTFCFSIPKQSRDD
jgi:PAS domain S-box-containing protein